MVYTINNIIEELNRRGFNAQTQVVTKNGVELNAVVIKSEANIAPTIYVDEVLNDINSGKVDFEVAISRIIEFNNAHKDVAFDDSVLKDKEFISSNLYIGLQRESKEEIVKRECGYEGIEAYLYIRLENFEEGVGTIKVNNKILDIADTSEDEAWKKAENNTFAETTVKPVFAELGEMIDLGVSADEYEERSCGLYVLSNKSKNLGASAILDKKALKALSDKLHSKKFFMLPSSRHEVLVVPDTGEFDIVSLTELVNMVNSNEVRPADQLGDRAYQFAI